MLDLAVISFFVAGVLTGLLVAWIAWLAADRRRRPGDHRSLAAERDEAVRRARAAMAATERARRTAEERGAALASAERRLASTRASIAEITTRIQALSPPVADPPPAAPSGGPGPEDLTGRAAPTADQHERARRHLEDERRVLRRRLAEASVALDELRNGPTSRAVHDPRFRRALDDLAGLWDEHRTIRSLHPLLDDRVLDLTDSVDLTDTDTGTHTDTDTVAEGAVDRRADDRAADTAEEAC